MAGARLFAKPARARARLRETSTLRTRESGYNSAGSYSFSDPANGYEGEGMPTTDIVLRSDGAVAFIA